MTATEEEIQAMLDVYEESEGYSRRAVRILRERGVWLSPKTIVKYWKKRGYKIRSRGGPRNTLGRSEIEEILESLKTNNGCVKVTAVKTGHSRKTVVKYKRLNDLL